MIIADTVTKENQDWLKKVLKVHEDDVLRLYLVYNDTLMGPDTAREVWEEVAGEDFVAAVESDIVSNESLRSDKQQGVSNLADEVSEGAGHHWFVELYVDDKEIWDVVK